MFHKFNTIPTRISAEFFVETDKLILKSGKGPRVVKTLLEKKNEVGQLYFQISKVTPNIGNKVRVILA
jgi:hypothetical protein